MRNSLFDRLDSSVPGWREAVDHGKIEVARRDGEFNELWLLKHLRDQLKAVLYKKVSGLWENVNIAQEPDLILSSFLSFDEFAFASIKDFLSADRKLEQMIVEYEKRNSEDVSLDLEEIYREETKKLQEFSDNWDLEFGRFLSDVSNFLNEMDRSLKKEWKEQEEFQLAVFRKDRVDLVEQHKQFLYGKILESLRLKAKKLGCSGVLTQKDVDFTSEEKEDFLQKFKELADEEILRQQKLRTGLVNWIMGKLICRSTSSQIIDFVNSFDILTGLQKRSLEDFILSGYINFDVDPNYFVVLASSKKDEYFQKIKKCARHILISEIFDAIEKAEEDNTNIINAIYDSPFYQVCNGGWWSGLANALSGGSCSIFNAAVGLIKLFKGKLSGLRELKSFMQVVKLLSRTPAKVTTCDFLKKILEDILEEALCDVVHQSLRNSKKLDGNVILLE